MSRRNSDATSEVNSFRTAEASNSDGESVNGYHNASGSDSLNEKSSGSTQSNAPSYSENPYVHKQTTQQGIREEDEENEEVAIAHNDRNTLGETQSVTPSTTSSRRRLTHSIKSYFRRGSHSSKDPDQESKKDADHEQEHKEETAEEHQKRMEDPEHLLNTILEEPEIDDQEAMMPVSEAAAVAGGAPSYSEAHSSEHHFLEKRKGYRENLMRTRKLRKYTKASHSIQTMRKWFTRFMNWSRFTRYFIYWVPLAIILFIPLGIGAWSHPDIQLGHTRVMWIFIWLEVVWGSLFITKAFAHYLPTIFGYLMSIFMPRWFKYVNMVHALEFATHLVLWTFITFISFAPILTDNRNALDSTQTKQPHWQKIVQEVTVAFLVSAIIFWVEQGFVYLLSTNFHRTRLALRIQGQKKSVNVLIILLDASFRFFPWRCPEFEEEDRGLQFASYNRAKRKAHAGSNNLFMRNVNKIVGTAAKNLGTMAEVKSSDKQPSCAKIVAKALTNRDTREILANRIWKSLVMEDSNFLTYEDLISVFGIDHKEEVLYMFDILDEDGMNGIDLDEMVESVHKIGKESKQIQKSLVDIDGAITKLHYLLMCIGLILIVVIFVGMLAPSSATVLATLGSTLLSMSFLFSATAQEVFQSCVFLFVKHPFDVGDWIQVSVPGLGLTRMKVIELNLTYSVFEQVGINFRRQVSNTVLSASFIDNISRSPPSQIAVTLTIGIPETTTEQLAEFETRLVEFVDSNPRDYVPGVFFHAVDQTDLDRLSLNICISTRNNQDDIGLFSTRRTKALEFISQCINDIPITIPRREDSTSHDPALPIFQYNISSYEEAMKYMDRSRHRRQPYGMRPPLDEDDDLLPNESAIADDDGYRDGPTGSAVSMQDSSNRAAASVRRTSFSSRMSRHSKAFSMSSKASNTFGLRSRRQVPVKLGAKPPTSASASAAPDDQGDHGNEEKHGA